MAESKPSAATPRQEKEGGNPGGTLILPENPTKSPTYRGCKRKTAPASFLAAAAIVITLESPELNPNAGLQRLSTPRCEERTRSNPQQSKTRRLGHFGNHDVVVQKVRVRARERCKRVSHAERNRAAVLCLGGVNDVVDRRVACVR